MARNEVIRVDQIRVPPEQRPDRGKRGDMVALAQDIATNDMTTPILVDDQYTLLDGARRLSLYRPDEKVRVYVAESMVEAMDFLTGILGKSDLQLPYDARRVWDLHMACKGLQEKYISSIRKHAGGRGGSPPPVLMDNSNGRNYIRIALTKATGMSEHRVQSTQYLYFRHTGKVEVDAKKKALLEDLIHQVENEGMNVYSAVRIFRKAVQEDEEVQGPQARSVMDQRNLLLSSVANLRAVARALSELGPVHERISAQDARTWKLELKTAKRAINRTINKLNERETRG